MFSRTVVNRVWANFMGRGLVDPVDDLRATNPASNEELLAALTKDFVDHGYDVQRLIRTIMNSSVYQLSSEANATNQSDNIYYSKHIIRRLSAEVILDAMSQVTGAPTAFAGYPAGTRALQLPDTQVKSEFLTSFGRPAAQSSAMPPSASSDPTIAQALHVINGDTLNKKLSAPDGTIALFLKLGLSRPPHSGIHVSCRRSAAIPADAERQPRWPRAGESAPRQRAPKRRAATPTGRRWKTWCGRCSPARNFFSTTNAIRSRTFSALLALAAPASADLFAGLAPDGATIALGGYKEMRLVDARPRKTIATLPASAEAVRAVAFSRDGKLLAAAGGLPARKGEVKIWDVARTDRQPRRSPATPIASTPSRFRPTARPSPPPATTSSSSCGTSRTGKEIRTLRDHIDAIYALAFTPDGKRLVSGAADRVGEDLGRRHRRRASTRSPNPPMASTPSRSRPTASAWPRAASIRRSASGSSAKKKARCENTLIAHEDAILKLAWSPDGKYLASASADRTIKMFRAADLTEVRAIAELSPTGPSGWNSRPTANRWPPASSTATGNLRGRSCESPGFEIARSSRSRLSLAAAADHRPPATAPRRPRSIPSRPLGIARGTTVEMTVEGLNLAKPARSISASRASPGASCA